MARFGVGFKEAELRAAANKNETKEQRLEHLAWLLNDLVYDLVTPPKVLRDYLSQPDCDPRSGAFLGIIRMCKSSAILAMTKLYDITNAYGREIKEFPDDILDQVRTYKSYVQTKKLVRFRSKFVAHNFDAFVDSSYAEGNTIANDIFGETLGEHLNFFEWVSPADPEDTFVKYHISYLVTRMRNHVISKVTPKPRI